MEILTKYIYYYKNDPDKEPIGVLKASSTDEATLKASLIKQIPLEDFKEIFKVERYGK